MLRCASPLPNSLRKVPVSLAAATPGGAPTVDHPSSVTTSNRSRQLALLGKVAPSKRTDVPLRAFLLKRGTRAVYQLEDPPPHSPQRTSTAGWPGHHACRVAPFVRLARHDPPPPRWHPRRHPESASQTPAEKASTAASASSATQPPLSRPAHRPRLPLLRRPRHLAPAMTFHHQIDRSTG